MAIRVRRGLYDDFDPAKMLPGEWAVAIDSDTSKQIVWMCFAPGVTKRMGTYEDFKQQIADATEEIKNQYLKEFEGILNQIEELAETASNNANTVIQIRDDVVNTYLPQMLEFFNDTEQNSQIAAEQARLAEERAESAEQSALMAESFTHGGTGLRENEAVDNAQYYLEQAKQISQSENGLIPMGTVSFADLSLSENQEAKYMFNIADDFVTDDTFKEGAGHSFPAGTNVFRTGDGYWDCLAGSFQTPNGDAKDNTVSFVQAAERNDISTGEKLSVIFGKIAKWFADLKTVAFSGSYSDLSDRPTIPAAVAVKGNAESTYRTGNVNLTPANIGAVAVGGDTAGNTVAFTSGDSTSPTGWTDVTALTSGMTHANFFNRVSTMFKNIRFLYSLLGSVDISAIGGGTVTGAVSAIYKSANNQIVAAGDVGFGALTGTANGVNYLRMNKLTGEVNMHFYRSEMSTTLTAWGVAFATIPEGYRPPAWTCALGRGFTGSAWEDVLIGIRETGEIYASSSQSRTYSVIAFDATWYTDFTKYTLET